MSVSGREVEPDPHASLFPPLSSLFRHYEEEPRSRRLTFFAPVVLGLFAEATTSCFGG